MDQVPNQTAAIAQGVKAQLLQQFKEQYIPIFELVIVPLYLNQGDALPSINAMAEYYFSENYSRSDVMTASVVSLICKAKHKEILEGMSEDEISGIYKTIRSDSETSDDFLNRIVEDYAKARTQRVKNFEIQGRVEDNPGYFYQLSARGKVALGNFDWTLERETTLFDLVQNPKYQIKFKDGSFSPNWIEIAAHFSQLVHKSISDTALKSKYYLLLADTSFLSGKEGYYIPTERFSWENHMPLINEIINGDRSRFIGSADRVKWREVIQQESLRAILLGHGFNLNDDDAVTLMIKHLSKAYKTYQYKLASGVEA